MNENTVENILSKIKIFSHAYIIESNDNEYALFFAKKMFQKILCKDYNKKSHDIKLCELCLKIENNLYVEIEHVKIEESSMKIENLRILKDKINKKSIYNNKRIYVIENAEKLGQYSSNALLKFIEEPEENIICVLITSNYYSILPTIRSRCQKLRINLKNEDKNINESLVSDAQNLVNLIQKKREKAILDVGNIIEGKDKNYLSSLLDEMSKIYLDKVKAKENTLENIKKIKVILDCKKDIFRNVNISLFFDKLILELGGK